MNESTGFALIVYLTVAAFVLSGCQSAKDVFDGGDAFIDTVRTAKSSVVGVICKRQRNSGGWDPAMDGTGFFVSSRGDFLTAAHVVKDFTDQNSPLRGCPMGIWVYAGEDAAGNVKAIYYDVARDQCVLDSAVDIAECHTALDLSKRRDGNVKAHPVSIASAPTADGTAVAITGFPLYNLAPVTSRGYVAGYQFGAFGDRQMLIDHAAWPGNSGGPVYDVRGVVVGIMLEAGQGAASGISFARPASDINTFMRNHPIGINQG